MPGVLEIDALVDELTKYVTGTDLLNYGQLNHQIRNRVVAIRNKQRRALAVPAMNWSTNLVRLAAANLTLIEMFNHLVRSHLPPPETRRLYVHPSVVDYYTFLGNKVVIPIDAFDAEAKISIKPHEFIFRNYLTALGKYLAPEDIGNQINAGSNGLMPKVTPSGIPFESSSTALYSVRLGSSDLLLKGYKLVKWALAGENRLRGLTDQETEALVSQISYLLIQLRKEIVRTLHLKNANPEELPTYRKAIGDLMAPLVVIYYYCAVYRAKNKTTRT